MPKAQDPHAVEAKEVADKAAGAAVTGPSPADVAASEVFGEPVTPFARLTQQKQALDERKAAEQRRQKEEAEFRADMEKLKTAFEAIGQTAKLELLTRLGEKAYEQGSEILGNHVRITLEGIADRASKRIIGFTSLDQEITEIARMALDVFDAKTIKTFGLAPYLKGYGRALQDAIQQIDASITDVEKNARYWAEVNMGGRYKGEVFVQQAIEKKLGDNERAQRESLRAQREGLQKRLRNIPS